MTAGWPATLTSVQPPDYEGNSLVNLMASIAVGLGADSHPYTPLRVPLPNLGKYQNVILLVVDGLGGELLQRQNTCPWLHAHHTAIIDSVFPSTTASAITTFLTGLAPQQHGLTGWHVYSPEVDCIAAVLPGRCRDTGEKLGRRAAGLLYDQQAFSDRLPVPSYSVVPSWIADSRYNVTYSRRAVSHPYSALPDFFNVLARTVKQSRGGPAYYYAYYPEVDRCSHEHGSTSKTVTDLLTKLDQGFTKLWQDLQGTDSLLIVTADHGFIDTSQSKRIELDEHPQLAACLLRPLCGESRVAYCYVKEDQRATFVEYVQTELAKQSVLIDSDTFIAQGHFGLGTPHPRLRDRIGDYVLLMRENYTLKDWLPNEEPYVHLGVHGGATTAERKVPLIIASTR